MVQTRSAVDDDDETARSAGAASLPGSIAGTSESVKFVGPAGRQAVSLPVERSSFQPNALHQRSVLGCDGCPCAVRPSGPAPSFPVGCSVTP